MEKVIKIIRKRILDLEDYYNLKKLTVIESIESCVACDDIIDNYVNDKIANFKGNIDAAADRYFNKAYNNVYLKEVAKLKKYHGLKGVN